MRIEDIWKELENEAAGAAPGSWLSRFALPQPANPVLVAVEVSSRQRALLLPLPAGFSLARREWPHCRGLEVTNIVIGGIHHVGIRLADAGYEDVFTALAEDVAPRIAAAPSGELAARVLLDRLRRWQKFLTARRTELSPAAQKGLYGELNVLRKWLMPAFGLALSVAHWRAPLATHQDFQLPGGAIEVKSTSATQPQSVRITSERQLDESGIRALFLVIVTLDEREVEGDSGTGETLPEIVADLRRHLSESEVLLEEFDDRLLDVGYLDTDAQRFDKRRYTVRSEHAFRVQQGFPRLLERDLPVGIGDASYALSVAACSPFEVPMPDAIATLQQED